ncbi:Uncharacterized protein PECH_007243 [Penicillium ucsense]|uniref:molybdopterin adenylyltransferase n=1 Tax=Penicillium ucsense TaxID=2839758 RepID=A0A8J8VYD3_9EURO|nr:Uncharacterized protein PECM_001746 [Penicillium ucsense]KAF7735075.1 Uncharacterized protein PECH_007243 [Penicillium ucsense]
MTLSYSEAIDLLRSQAQLHKAERNEQIPLNLAVNRISSNTLRAAHSTPLWDTSAMDGYAVCSQVTQLASPQNPIIIPVVGVIAAGKQSILTDPLPGPRSPFCVEIMTGARFPDPQTTVGVELDACVKFEDVHKIQDQVTGQHLIKVTKPVVSQQNRRLAGHDFRQDQVVISAGERIRPRHVMALASVGIHQIWVQGRLQIGLYSTGSELLSRSTENEVQQNKLQIQDVNGPYLVAALSDGIDADVRFLGILDDHADTITDRIMQDVISSSLDLVISTGAVSAGRFDLIPTALEALHAKILFHKLNIRPGHPALAALVPSETGGKQSTPFFGLPGNPVASAACLRFLVMPFIRFLGSEAVDTPLKASLIRTDKENTEQASHIVTTLPIDKDVFRPGILTHDSQGRAEVTLIADHSPGKVSPFLKGNCWIHFHTSQQEVCRGDVVDVYPGL